MLMYLVRHGQTEDNLAGIIQGQADSPLTAYGIESLKKTSESLKDKKVDLVISSPIGRAYTSAIIIANIIGVKSIITEDGLKEIDLKPWEKESKDYLRSQENRNDFDVYRNNPEAFMPTSGESLIELQERVMESIFHIMKMHYGKNIVIVSHEVAIRAVISFILHSTITNDFWSGSIPQSSITEIEPLKILHIGACV